MEDYIIHALIGLAGAVTGYWARDYCIHAWHRVTLMVVLVSIEAVVSVQLVG